MNKKIRDLYAPVYEKAMRSDRKMYQLMYKRIPKVIKDKDVLEIAGVSFDHQWSTKGYCEFLESNGWKIKNFREMKARISLAYVECVRAH